MSGECWIEEEARRLCLCRECKPGAGVWGENCRATVFADAIRAGLAKAAELAAENEACHVCGCELLPPDGKPYCEDSCSRRNDPAPGEDYDIDHGGYVSTSERIRALLGEG